MEFHVGQEVTVDTYHGMHLGKIAEIITSPGKRDVLKVEHQLTFTYFRVEKKGFTEVRSISTWVGRNFRKVNYESRRLIV